MVNDDIIQKEYLNVQNKYTKLNPPEKYGHGWVISGAIDVIDIDGNYWDTYSIRIFIPREYPKELPVLEETGNKIRREADWHNSNGVCCLSTNAKMFHTLGNDITILRWLDLFAHPFLANHVYKLKTGSYANKEYDHGIEGIVQGYMDIFGVTTKLEVIEKLQRICALKKQGRNDLCACGSGKKNKNCYLLHAVQHTYGIPFVTLTIDLTQINKPPDIFT